MNDNFFFFINDYSDNKFLALLKPSFCLKITFQNYDNEKICEIDFNNDLIICLPKNIEEVIKSNKEVQNYILSFTDDFYLHIDIKLFNNNEYISGEFLIKNVKILKEMFKKKMI